MFLISSTVLHLVRSRGPVLVGALEAFEKKGGDVIGSGTGSRGLENRSWLGCGTVRGSFYGVRGCGGKCVTRAGLKVGIMQRKHKR